MRFAMIASTVLIVGILISACGDDDGGSNNSSPTPSGGPESGSPTATPSGTFQAPFEGPPRGPVPTERTDFREEPEWQLPEPADLPAVPDDENAAIFFPPSEVACAEEWILLARPSEGFTICYPQDWQTAGEAYVNEGAADKWYSVAMVKFADDTRDNESAHVSVYAIPRYAKPMPYTRDCPRPYSIEFAGQPSVICPAFPGEAPEEDFTSYHVRRGDMDYFINVVPYQGGGDEAYNLAVQIAHTFQLLEQPTP
jgi:hypothetical protein